MAIPSATTKSGPATLVVQSFSCQASKCENNIHNRSCEHQQHSEHAVSNEYVLNIAFLSFAGFTALQFFFAILANSQSMMADCAAMSVDVISYLVNFWAERLKHGSSPLTMQQLRLKRLYLELIPPLVSVITLVTVTVLSLQSALDTLILVYNLDPEQNATTTTDDTTPKVGLMLLFSGLNLLLDFLNVFCFARVEQAVGWPGQHGNEHIHVHYEHSHRAPQEQQQGGEIPHETTPLVSVFASGTRDEVDDDEEEDNDQSTVSSEVETQGRNLNMCSAWTHVCADTLRSIAVLAAASFSVIFPNSFSPAKADSWGAIVVSIIILISLAPLIQGLYATFLKIRVIWTENHQSNSNLKHVVIVV